MLPLFCSYTLVTFPTFRFTYPASKLDIMAILKNLLYIRGHENCITDRFIITVNKQNTYSQDHTKEGLFGMQWISFLSKFQSSTHSFIHSFIHFHVPAPTCFKVCWHRIQCKHSLKENEWKWSWSNTSFCILSLWYYNLITMWKIIRKWIIFFVVVFHSVQTLLELGLYKIKRKRASPTFYVYHKIIVDIVWNHIQFPVPVQRVAEEPAPL